MNKTIVRIFVVLVICILVGLGIYFIFKSVNIGTNSLPANINYNTVELNLQNKGLTSLPSEIGKLTKLTTFDVSHNSLTGALPAEIGKFTRLELLDASDNNLTGIPAEIGKLTNLQIIDFSNNDITDYPMEIYNLTQLKTLDLTNNPISQEKIDILKEKLPNTTILF